MRICTECCVRARPKEATHIAGTTHKAGAAEPWVATGPDDDDAEAEEAEPEDSTAGEEDDEPEGPEGASGMLGDKPAATRALAA